LPSGYARGFLATVAAGGTAMKSRFVAAALLILTASQALATDVIEDWASVKVPAPPELKAAKLDPKTTALLLLDFNGHEQATSGPCNKATRPRCLATIPKVRALLDKARASGVFVVYSISSNGTPADIQPEIAPGPTDPVVSAGPDKFIGANLGDLLHDKGIKTVVVTGTASEGAVLDTGTDAALHGMNIVVPVDGMASTELYAEQYVAWHLTHAPGVSTKTTLTRVDLITF
jgi:nicotinamidase-related amidase